MGRLCLLAGSVLLLAAGGWGTGAVAQDAARPTGDYVLAQLDAAQQGVAQQAKTHPDAALGAVVQQLGQMEDALRKQLGSAMNQPIEIMDGKVKGADKDAAARVGKLLAERAGKAGVKDVVFDRGGYIYHGRVKALADAAREAGLNF